MKEKKTLIQLLILLFLVAALPAILYLSRNTQEFRGKAVVNPVVLTVDLSKTKPISRIWQNLSQGGETPIPQLAPVVNQIRELSPIYIRIDHIFDAYGVVKRDENGKIVYDFSILDEEVDAIGKSGAIPFFSLSYIPSDFVKDSPDRPMSFDLWQDLVEKTVSHYSGKRNKNIANIFYEVYNEPDLFGKWTVSEYMQLYEASVRGTQAAINANTFFVGGPALSYFDRNFMGAFINTVQEKNLRLDFISWHVYSPMPAKIARDADVLDTILLEKPLKNRPITVISEWGSYPQKHIWHDNAIDSSHLVATVARSLGAVDMLMYFEIKDGDSEAVHGGGWGILKNEKAGFAKKPRFYALSLLNSLRQLSFAISGESENIYMIASGTSPLDMSLLISHYSFGKSSSILPSEIRFVNMLPGIYEVKKAVLNGIDLQKESASEILPVAKSEGSLQLELFPDTVTSVDVKRISAAVEYAFGFTNNSSDRSAKLSKNGSPLVYPMPISKIPKTIEASFVVNPQESLYDSNEIVLFETSSIRLAKTVEGFAQVLVLSATDTEGNISKTSLFLSSNDVASWHAVKILLDNTRSLISLSFDGRISQGELKNPVSIGEIVSFGKMYEGAIDNIRIIEDGKTILIDDF